MLSENIRAVRKAKGLSQEELAVRLNVVRQTVSKWEAGLSVPDADLLIRLSEELETPVNVLLGETVTEVRQDELAVIAEKLAEINGELARRKDRRRSLLRWFCILLCAGIAAVSVLLLLWQSPYQSWDYSDPETAVFGAAFHVFEYGFVRAAPLVFIAGVVGIVLTRKKG